jgi:hypothetical protein
MREVNGGPAHRLSARARALLLQCDRLAPWSKTATRPAARASDRRNSTLLDGLRPPAFGDVEDGARRQKDRKPGSRLPLNSQLTRFEPIWPFGGSWRGEGAGTAPRNGGKRVRRGEKRVRGTRVQPCCTPSMITTGLSANPYICWKPGEATPDRPSMADAQQEVIGLHPL